MAAKEADPNQLIDELAGIMKSDGVVNPPEWSQFIKTGSHVERPPENEDWWYVRAASVLRQVYMRGPIGVGKLRGWYGGRRNRGARPERHCPAGGKIIRVCLQQLEAAGLIAKDKVGRKITSKGQALIDKTAAAVKPREEPKKAVKKTPAKKDPAKKKTVKKDAKETPKEESPKEKPKEEAAPKEKKPAKKTTKKTTTKKTEEAPVEKPTEAPTEKPVAKEEKAVVEKPVAEEATPEPVVEAKE